MNLKDYGPTKLPRLKDDERINRGREMLKQVWRTHKMNIFPYSEMRTYQGTELSFLRIKYNRLNKTQNNLSKSILQSKDTDKIISGFSLFSPLYVSQYICLCMYIYVYFYICIYCNMQCKRCVKQCKRHAFSTQSKYLKFMAGWDVFLFLFIFIFLKLF